MKLMVCRHPSRIGIALMILAASAGSSFAQDWPQWRGPNRDGSVTSFKAPTAWPEKLTQRWKVEVGLGYATPLIVGDRIYMFSRQGENEVMSALDAATGKTLWQTGYPATFTMQGSAARHGAGPKSTPVFSGGKLYSIGMTGAITAFDAATGKQLWQKPGSPAMPRYTTHSFSPLVDRGLVFFHPGGHNQGALTALDANTGEVKWTWPGDGPGYGSPIVADFAGTRQVVTITQNKIVGIEAATGALLWEVPSLISNFTNSITPILYGKTIIVSATEHPVRALAPTKREGNWVVDTLWENPETTMRMSNGVIISDMLFSLTTRNSGQYFSLDAETGKTRWLSEGRQAGNAAIVSAGNVALSLEDDGELVVFRSGPAAFEPIRRYKVADTDTWTAPAVSGNRIFVKDVSSLTLWTVN